MWLNVHKKWALGGPGFVLGSVVVRPRTLRSRPRTLKFFRGQGLGHTSRGQGQGHASRGQGHGSRTTGIFPILV